MDFDKIKESGIRRILFSKDNTLTKIDENKFLSPKIEAPFEKACHVFGQENVSTMGSFHEGEYYLK